MIKKMYRHLKAIRNNQFVLIYTKGKVGSKSIARSFNEIRYKIVDIHAFKLYRDFSKKMYAKYKSVRIIHHHLMFKNLSMKIYRKIELFLIKHSRNQIKIITCVREPIGRNISMYMQDIHIPILNQAITKNIVKNSDTTIDSFVSDFFTNFNHRYGIEWFDKEFKRNIKVNVYNYPFDKNKGYTIIETKKYKILIMQLEKLNQLVDVIRDFSNQPTFNLINENVGQYKWYSSVLKDMKDNMSFNQTYIDDLLKSDYTKHFYSNQDILKFEEKYKRFNQ